MPFQTHDAKLRGKTERSVVFVSFSFLVGAYYLIQNTGTGFTHLRDAPNDHSIILIAESNGTDFIPSVRP